MKVGVIVLQYNQADSTVRCLESIRNIDYSDFFVVVIDNDSQADHKYKTLDFLDSLNDERFIFVSRDVNDGFAGGNNAGIKEAIQRGAEYILILNNDTVVIPTILKELLGQAGPDAVITSPINEGDRIVYGGSYQWLAFEGRHVTKPIISLNPPSTYPIGACLFIPATVFNSVGFLDERYFLYFEDIDFAVRLKKASFEIKTTTEVLVQHAASSSTKALGSPLLLRLHYRNALLFQWTHGPFWVRIALIFQILILLVWHGLKYIFKDRKIEKAILQGVFDFIKGKFGKP